MTQTTLYLVGIPIGESSDLTQRARECLHSTELWIGESQQGLASLKQMSERIETATFQFLNRNSTDSDVTDLVSQIKKEGSAVLVSDAGMPAVADPGVRLAQACIVSGIRLVPIPGVSSILSALVVSGFSLNHWYYAGFLPRDKAKRRDAINHLNDEPLTTLIMETPYRLLPMLDDLADKLTPDRQIILAWQLTCPDERILRGTAVEVLEKVHELGLRKGEFVIVIDSH